jgi:hypothetical protein
VLMATYIAISVVVGFVVYALLTWAESRRR